MDRAHWFLLAALAWTGLAWWPVALASQGVLGIPVPTFLVPIGGLGLVLLPALFAWKEGGRPEVRALFARGFRPAPRPGGWVWAVAPAALLLLVMVVFAAVPARSVEFVLRPSPLVLGILLIAWIEEFAWRGYALPRLLRGHSPFVASALLAGAWLPFHLPFYLMEGYNAWGAAGWLAWAPWYLLYPFFLTWLALRTGHSVLAATLSHFCVNWVVGWFGPASTENVAALGASPLLLGLVVWSWRRRDGAGDPA